MVDKANCVQLGLACADVCQALGRGIDGKQADQPSQSSLRTIEQFTTWVGLISHALDDSLIDLPIAGLWQRSRNGSSSGANGTRFLAVSTQSTMKRQLLTGGWIWTRFAVFLMYVASLCPAVAKFPLPDWPHNEYRCRCLQRSS